MYMITFINGEVLHTAAIWYTQTGIITEVNDCVEEINNDTIASISLLRETSEIMQLAKAC